MGIGQRIKQFSLWIERTSDSEDEVDELDITEQDLCEKQDST